MKSRHVCVSKFHTAGELPVQCRSLSLSLPAPIPPPPAMFFQPWSLSPPFLPLSFSFSASSFLLPDCKPVHSLSPLSPNSFPSNFLSPSNHLTACPSNYTCTGKIPCSPSCPIILPLLSVLFCILLPLSKVWRHCKLCNIVYTQFRENPAQQHTLTHTQQKRMHPAYNQRKKSHGPPAVVDKVHRSSTWVKVQIRIIKYYSSKRKYCFFNFTRVKVQKYSIFYVLK